MPTNGLEDGLGEAMGMGRSRLQKFAGLELQVQDAAHH
jgi:hypothetical protein